MNAKGDDGDRHPIWSQTTSACSRRQPDGMIMTCDLELGLVDDPAEGALNSVPGAGIPAGSRGHPPEARGLRPGLSWKDALCTLRDPLAGTGVRPHPRQDIGEPELKIAGRGAAVGLFPGAWGRGLGSRWDGDRHRRVPWVFLSFDAPDHRQWELSGDIQAYIPEQPELVKVLKKDRHFAGAPESPTTPKARPVRWGGGPSVLLWTRLVAWATSAARRPVEVAALRWFRALRSSGADWNSDLHEPGNRFGMCTELRLLLPGDNVSLRW